MPLPIIPPSSKTDLGIFKSIKDRVLGQKAAENDTTSPAPAALSENPKTEPFKKVTTSTSPSSFRRTGSLPSAANQPNMGNLSFQRNQAANDKAIARSQGMMNPLIPLIENVNHTLVGIDKTLKSILSVLENKLGGLQSGMGDSGLGFGDIASSVVGGAVGAKVLKKGAGIFKGGPKVPPAAGVPKKPGLFSKLFGPSGSSIADAAHGVSGSSGAAGAAEAGAAAKGGGWFSKLGKFFGTGGKVLSKVAAPLTVAMTMAENMDELQKTGAVDPLNQVMKAGGGLGKVFDTEKPFFSMSRLEGAGEAVSGATGAVYRSGHPNR